MAIDVMELRLGVEVEAAGLAAERADTAALERIDAAFREIEGAVGRGEAAVDQDFAFHASIAAATGNPQFQRFLHYLGRFIIPRLSIGLSPGAKEAQRAYLGQIQQEHREIGDAIRRRDVPEARAAMRRHLGGSLERYRKLAEINEGGTDDT